MDTFSHAVASQTSRLHVALREAAHLVASRITADRCGCRTRGDDGYGNDDVDPPSSRESSNSCSFSRDIVVEGRRRKHFEYSYISIRFARYLVFFYLNYIKNASIGSFPT